MPQTSAIEIRDKADIGKVCDLAGGEARLSEVMEEILVGISPRVCALISPDPMGQQPAGPTGSGTVVAGQCLWRGKAECLDTLAPLLLSGRNGHIGPDWAKVVDFLTTDLDDEVRDSVRSGERVSPSHLVLATPGLGVSVRGAGVISGHVRQAGVNSWMA